MAIEDLRLVSIGVDVAQLFPVDTICVDITLGGTHDTREECTGEYNRLLDEVTTAFERAGFPREKVRNNDFRISAHTENLYCKERSGRYYYQTKEVRGYDYTAHMRLDAPFSTEGVKAIWVALTGCDDAVRYSIGFCLHERAAAKASILAEAVAEGRRRAEVLAEASGARLAGIHSISYEYDGETYRDDCICSPSAPASASDDLVSSAPDFNPRDELIECSVRMQWRMELA